MLEKKRLWGSQISLQTSRAFQKPQEKCEDSSFSLTPSSFWLQTPFILLPMAGVQNNPLVLCWSLAIKPGICPVIVGNLRTEERTPNATLPEGQNLWIVFRRFLLGFFFKDGVICSLAWNSLLHSQRWFFFFKSSCLHLPSAGIIRIDLVHMVLGLNLGLWAWQGSNLPTELHPLLPLRVLSSHCANHPNSSNHISTTTLALLI